MSDCSMFELEDIAWDIFGDSYDRVVPHGGAQTVNSSDPQGDSHKKARHDTQNANECNTGNNGSREKDVIRNTEGAKFPLSFDTDCRDEVTGLASDDSVTSDSCFNGQDTSGTESFSGKPTYETNSIADEGELCIFSFDTPAETNISFLENEPKYRRNSDLVDYDWPDFSTFDDVERMLSYSAFRQEGYEKVDAVSWLSSSPYIINGSERNSKSEFPSSSPELGVPRDSSQVGIILWNENDTPSLNSCKSSDFEYGSLKHELETNTQVNVVFKGQDSIGRNNSNRAHQLEHKGKHKALEYVTAISYHVPGLVVQCKDQTCISSSVSPSQAYCSVVEHQNHFLEPDSSDYKPEQTTFIKSTRSYDSEQDPILPSMTSSKDTTSESSTRIPVQLSCNENQFINNPIDSLSHSPTSVSAKKMEEMRLEKQPPKRLTISHPTQNQASSSEITYRSSIEKNLYKLDTQVGHDDLLVKGSQLHTGFNIDASFSKGNSCTSLSERMLSSPTTLQQLQDVTDLLDIKTKLCIRDGLYRLARCAEQRHNVESPRSGCRETMELRSYSGDKSKRCHGLMDLEMETGTNPIDRSIVHLLFGGASEHPPTPRI